MTAMTKKIIEAIDVGVDNCLRLIPALASIDQKTMFANFWTAEDFAMMETARGKLSSDCFPYINSSLKAEREVPVDIPLPEDHSGTIHVMLGVFDSGYRGLYPDFGKPLTTPPQEAKAALDDAVLHLMRVGFERAAFSRINHYADNARSLEELRYLIPGIVTVLNKAHEPQLAVKVEQVRKRPSTIQPLDAYDLKMIRYINQLFATHALLDTFSRQPPAVPYGSMRLTLATMVDGSEYNRGLYP